MMTRLEMVKELKTRNLSQVARDISVTRVYLSHLANGKRPQVSWEMVKRISDYLEVDK
tara:strand:+ start:1604 stop:1777 length:174 start_codon:yes stop_codon:yes gene_type:complete